MDQEKQELSVENENTSAVDRPETDGTPAAEKEAVSAPPKRKRGRPRKQPTPPEEPKVDHAAIAASGARRGRYRLAAWLGLVVILLALVGLITLVSMGVQIIRRATDQSDLLAELTDKALPVAEYLPQAFTSLDQADSETLLLASIYTIVDSERIRQLQEHSGDYLYEQDDYGRLLIPTADITAAYTSLFGSDTQPVYASIGSDDHTYAVFEYDEDANCMHVPIYSSSSLYTVIADRIQVKGKSATIQVGYVLQTNIQVDDHGNQITPTLEQAEYSQWFSFAKTEDGSWVLTAVSDSAP